MFEDISPGTKVMVADAGGGTFDVLSARIDSTDPLSLRILSTASGEAWGGAAVNRNFLEFFEELFPGAATLDEQVLHAIIMAFEDGKKLGTWDVLRSSHQPPPSLSSARPRCSHGGV